MSTDLPSFERAEYGAAAEPCARCRQPLTGEFYQMNGVPLCEACANAAVNEPAAGSETAFVKAIAVGVGAAVVGSILYAVIEIATGWTIGYVALAVGWLVGRGMKLGSEGRGGRRYQIVAAVLTYLSVSCASLIVILHAVRMPTGTAISYGPALLGFFLKYGLLAPFLDLKTGVGGVIGLFILFIGIRAAWTMTAGSNFRITGPHTVADGGRMKP